MFCPISLVFYNDRINARQIRMIMEPRYYYPEPLKNILIELFLSSLSFISYKIRLPPDEPIRSENRADFIFI